MESRPPRNPDPGRHPAPHGRLCGQQSYIIPPPKTHKVCITILFLANIWSSTSLARGSTTSLISGWMISKCFSHFCASISEPKNQSPAVHVSVLVLDGQTGELPLQLAKARPGCQIGAQEQSTQNVSVTDEKGGEEGGNFCCLSSCGRCISLTA